MCVISPALTLYLLCDMILALYMQKIYTVRVKRIHR